jgi:hypothetical protein
MRRQKGNNSLPCVFRRKERRKEEKDIKRESVKKWKKEETEMRTMMKDGRKEKCEERYIKFAERIKKNID